MSPVLSPSRRFDSGPRTQSQSPPLPIPPQEIRSFGRSRVYIGELNQHLVPLMPRSVLPGLAEIIVRMDQTKAKGVLVHVSGAVSTGLIEHGCITALEEFRIERY